MAMSSACEYGLKIKRRLLDDDIKQTQKWLIDEVRKQTGLYFDDSYLGKIMRGDNKNPKIIAAINEILGLPSNQDSA